jgi:tetratricopeptide (TPR) repeat protein
MAVEGSQDVLDEIAPLVTQLRALPPTTAFVELVQLLSNGLAEGDAAAASALDREAVAAARAIGDPETIVRAIFQSHWVSWVAGDIDATCGLLLEALHYAESTGATQHVSEVLGTLAVVAAMRGDLAEAVEYVARSNERAIASGSSLARSNALPGASWTAYWLGDLPTAVDLARQGVAFAIDAGVRVPIAHRSTFLGEILDLAGELAEARAVHEGAIESLASAPSKGTRAEARTRLVKTLVSLGDLPEARRHAELARAEVEPGDVYTMATTAAARAAVSAAEGDADEAERLYREALETIGRSGYVLQRMEINRDFGTFLIDRGRASEARPLIEAVRAFYDTPATPWMRERAEALLRRCAAVPR